MNKTAQDQQTQARITDCDSKLARMRQQLEILQWDISLEEKARAAFVKELGFEPPKAVTGNGGRKVTRKKGSGMGSIGFSDAVKAAIHGTYLPSKL